uniref:Uncharacterized protein n=1 Tax=Mustela putorius furo TaxID=9669 RepID=M3YYV8_MUSPF
DHERRLRGEEYPEERKKEIPRREEDRNQRSCGTLGPELRKCAKNEGGRLETWSKKPTEVRLSPPTEARRRRCYLPQRLHFRRMASRSLKKTVLAHEAVQGLT